MKALLREAGASAIMLCALNINSQTLIGLPQYGVTLSGSIDNINIDNASGRDVIAAALHYRDARGDGPVDADLVTNHLRRGKASTSLSWGTSAALKAQKNIVSVTLDAVIFGDGEYVSAAPSGHPEQDFDSFHLLTVKLETEQATARNKSAWAQLASQDLIRAGLEQTAIAVIQERVAKDLLGIRMAEGDGAANAAADRSSKLPKTWRRPQAPPSGLAWFLRAFAPVLAQGVYGTFDPATYAGDLFWGPQNVPTGTYSPQVGTRARCLTPSFAYGQWMGIYLGPTYSGCPNGSDMDARIQWIDPGSGFTFAGLWTDTLPKQPIRQAWWTWYNWCSNINNGPILSGHCSYTCDGNMPCQR